MSEYTPRPFPITNKCDRECTISKHEHLNEGEVFVMLGEEYLVAKLNRVNLVVLNLGTKVVYNYHRDAGGTAIRYDQKALNDYHLGKMKKFDAVVPQTEKSFKLGDPVTIVGSKYKGKTGLVCKVNPKNYHVVIRKLGVVSFHPSFIAAESE
jgi:ribosomal protein L21E